MQRRLTPFILLAVVMLGTGLGIGLGLIAGPSATLAPSQRLPHRQSAHHQLRLTGLPGITPAIQLCEPSTANGALTFSNSSSQGSAVASLSSVEVCLGQTPDHYAYTRIVLHPLGSPVLRLVSLDESQGGSLVSSTSALARPSAG